MMIRFRVAVIVVPALALTLASCGGTAEGLAPVTGKVVCDGQPAAGAILLFHRQPGEPAPRPRRRASSRRRPSATTGPSSSRVPRWAAGLHPASTTCLSSGPSRTTPRRPTPAARPRSQRVGGKQVVVAKHDKLDPVPSDRLKGRYSDSSKPQLKAEIKPGSTDLGTLEITLK